MSIKRKRTHKKAEIKEIRREHLQQRNKYKQRYIGAK